MSCVTFIGTGAIGLPMALRLAAAGHSVTGVDPFEGARTRVRDAGLAVVQSYSEAPLSEIVVVMVATPEQLQALISEATAEVNSAKLNESLWILMSTVGPSAVKTAALALAQYGVRIVDAPVTGGVAGAVGGKLTIFASGSEADVAEAQSALESLGSVRNVGAVIGDGQAVKVVNQHLASVHLVAAAEALALAEHLGLSPEAVFELIRHGAAGSWMLNDRGPRMLQGENAAVLSTIGIFIKDSGLVAEAANKAGVSTPLLLAARDRFLQAGDAGQEKCDDSSVIRTYF